MNRDVSSLVIVGAILAIFFVIASIFVRELAFFNLSYRYQALFTDTSDYTWYNGFWGYWDAENDKIVYFSNETSEAASGIIIIIGALVCFSKQKTLSLVGSILMVIGISIWSLQLVDNFTQFLRDLGANPSNYTIFNLIVGSERFPIRFLNLEIGAYTVDWNLGLGYYGTLVGSILSLAYSIKAMK
jgi:hypothetical protein